MMVTQDPDEWPTYIPLCLPTVPTKSSAPPTPSTIENPDNVLGILPHPAVTDSRDEVDQMRKRTPRAGDKTSNCWTANEDEKLLGKTDVNGSCDEPSEHFPGRTSVACRMRCARLRRSKQLSGNKGQSSCWTTEDDRKLLKLEDFLGKHWVEIAKHFPERTSIACRLRCARLQKSKQNLGDKEELSCWTTEDDKELLRLRDFLGKDWDEILKHFSKRTFDACIQRYRWLHGLKPVSGKYRHWTAKEDRYLFVSRNSGRKNWKEISKHLAKRTPLACRLRYRVFELRLKRGRSTS